jgi:hypothetical protein
MLNCYWRRRWNQPRSYLHAWPERVLEPDASDITFSPGWTDVRRGEPIAYLLGRREFWSLELEVTFGHPDPAPGNRIAGRVGAGTTASGSNSARSPIWAPAAAPSPSPWRWNGHERGSSPPTSVQQP